MARYTPQSNRLQSADQSHESIMSESQPCRGIVTSMFKIVSFSET